MPLTFAHPAVVLPFLKKSKYINILAMVLGSMAPDFEYFLRGMPAGAVGHSLFGFIFLNLPIVIIVYLIYLKFVHRMMFVHLPVILQFSSLEKVNINKVFQLFVFLYSTLFGMLTHVLWDSFTHLNGFMVKKLSILTNSVSIMNIQIPIYKLLQHGSTLLGIMAIICFMLYRAAKDRHIKNDKVNRKQKWMYWSRIALLTLFIFCIWCVSDRISITFYGVIVVRIIDSTLISLLIVSMYYNHANYEKKFT